MANKISVLIDVTVDNANRAIKGFKQSVTDADGAVGKLKAGTKSTFDSIKANAGTMAVAAGGSLLAFGAKAVTEFQNVALEAGKMSEALGLPVEDASRLIEVAGDIGIEADALEKSLGRMNLTAGQTPGYFDEIGASISRNKDGTINVKDTFLNVVDALNSMPDAAKRAEAAQRIFGRSWQNMAELIGLGADGITTAMGEVSDAKVIDQAELQKARDLRAAFDALKDAIDNITLAVGESLAPAVAESAEELARLVGWAEKLKLLDLAGWANELAAPLEPLIRLVDVAEGKTDIYGQTIHRVSDEQMAFVRAAKEAGLSAEEVNAALEQGITDLDEYYESEKEATEAAIGLGGELKKLGEEAVRSTGELVAEAIALDNAGRKAEDAERKTANLTRQHEALRRELSDRAGYLTAQEGIAALATQAQETGDVTELQVIRMKEDILEYGAQADSVADKERVAEINTLLDQGNYDLAALMLSELEKTRTVRYNVAVNNATNATNTGRQGGVPWSHTGSRFEAGEGKAIIPDEQLFVPDTAGRMYSPAESQRMLGGGQPPSVTNNYTFNGVQDPADAVRRFEAAMWQAGAK